MSYFKRIVNLTMEAGRSFSSVRHSVTPESIPDRLEGGATSHLNDYANTRTKATRLVDERDRPRNTVEKEKEKEKDKVPPSLVSESGDAAAKKSSPPEKLELKDQPLRSATPIEDSSATLKKSPVRSQKNIDNIVPSVSSASKIDQLDKISEPEIKKQQKDTNAASAISKTTYDGSAADHIRHSIIKNSSSLPKVIKQTESGNDDITTTAQQPLSEGEPNARRFGLSEKRHPDPIQPVKSMPELRYDVNSRRDLVDAEVYDKEQYNNNNHEKKDSSKEEITATPPLLIADEHKQEGKGFSNAEKDVLTNLSIRDEYGTQYSKVMPANPDAGRHLPTIHLQQEEKPRSEIVVTVNIGRIDIKAPVTSERKSLMIKSEFSPALSLGDYLKRRSEGKKV